MKSEEELLREAEKYYDTNGPFLLLSEGYLFPFKGKKLQNPLDPAELVKASKVSTYEAQSRLSAVIHTCVEATMLRDKGYKILARGNSGCPRVIDVNGFVIILPDYASKKGLYLPMLSTQLADNVWVQNKVKPWDAYGFTNPEKIDVREISHKSHDRWDTERSTTVYSFGKNHTLTVEWISEGLRHGCDTYYNFFLSPKAGVSPTTPKYVWQDKGEEDDT